MNTNSLTEILYAILTSPAIPPHHAVTLMEELLETLNYYIVSRSSMHSSNRIRIKAEYKDCNGEADFTSTIMIDSGIEDIDNQVPRVSASYRVGKHIIS